MAVYKVIQDIESEDKLLGPLSLKGFIYAAIAGILAFVEFRLIFIGTPLKWVFIIAFALPMILFIVLASPLGHEQPTEVWLLSRIRFFFKSHTRIWDQEGINNLVTITVPKKNEQVFTDGLSQNEVKSRLKTLALTLDTRGWAVKNVDVNLDIPETPQKGVITPESDRLVKPGGQLHQMAVVDVHAADDILDEKNNPTAQKFEDMMQKAEVERRHGIMSALRDLVDGDGSSDKTSDLSSSKDLPSTKAALNRLKKSKELEALQRSEQKHNDFAMQLAKARSQFSKEHVPGQKPVNSRHKIIQNNPVTEKAAKVSSPTPNPTPVTAASQTVNMELAQSGNAFSVATLQGLANRQPLVVQTGPNEVTISLH